MINDSDTIQKTRFYTDCIGVFQGGGCRAVAYGGAYESAYGLGVRFSEVAGTSAGAIAAALIAAGADPAFLTKQLKQLDFKKLIAKPETPAFRDKPSWRAKFFSKIPFKGALIEKACEIFENGGLYSSENIEIWLEDALRTLVGKSNGRVEFRDLVIPLYVVAGDLSKAKARIWSTRDTPTESVAHAVRASCSIPFFFQPLDEGASFIIDGGVVSNTPHFLFSGRDARERLKKRILLFTLEANESGRKANDIIEFAQQLASLIVDGGSDLQLTLAPDLARIVIRTETIKATDFDTISPVQIDTLIEQGRQSVKKFIKEELINARSKATDSVIISDIHQAYLEITQRLYSIKDEVIVSLPDTRWFWELFPSVLHWRKNGIQVFLLTPKGAGTLEPEESQRRSILEGLGVCFVEQDQLPFFGFLFDSEQIGGSALIFPKEDSDYEPTAQYYSGRKDYAAINALRHRVSGIAKDFRGGFVPLVHSIDDMQVLDRLKKSITYYREPQVSLKIEYVRIENIFLISRYVRAFRYKQIEALISFYKHSNLEIFAPAVVSLKSGKSSIITPPVLEYSGGKYVALEGNTRCLYCRNNGIPEIKAVVVRNVDAELPGKPVALKYVTITSQKRDPSERINNFNRSMFRDIERAIRPLNE